MRVNIIGGGLAGCALAYVLKQRGGEPIIYEAGDHVASGASGNMVGLYNPRFTAQYDAVADFYSTAFFEALKIFEQFDASVDWNPCGALHLIYSDQKRKRYPKTCKIWGWDQGDMRIVDAHEASDLAGMRILHDCLYLARAGTVSPRKLCAAYVRDVEIYTRARVDDLLMLDGDVTVLACGMGVLNFSAAGFLPLKPVRGQVSYVSAVEGLSALKTALCYGGYVAPAGGGGYCLGATFERDVPYNNVCDSDDRANLEQLFRVVPALAGSCEVSKSWAGVRTASKDHFPVVGRVAGALYVSAGHGSHGILSSLLSAIILANIILNKKNHIVKPATVSALSPERFV